MNYRNTGFSTLLVTSMLLSAMLLLTLGLYKSAFLNIKQIQNQISYRKNYWYAEGGLECAFAYLQYHESVTGSASFCEQLDHSVQVTELGENYYQLESSRGYVLLTRNVVISYGDTEGEESSSANIFHAQWQKGSWYEH
ncbi:hypothetical protein [Vibrio marisflavi]|uniref:Uncharacterized protein n=1 Tax=Vibrio marisflavi CECT 7928 TaxID=634439 RepID=A0ABM9A392_9VIBR|nr:hypothetical protein [Vibrio marisflavi]CAH0538869.1 hypothetical protein VMF7928_01729 [Vibrio marisflavi CECT 7928]